jgi:hypothetical protein
MADPNDGGKIADRNFQIIVSAMDDCRRFIAAGKVQRWDVVKWGVTVNTGLAAATVFGGNIAPFLFAIAVAVVSLLLVWHYNKRVTGARQTAITLTKCLKDSFEIDYDDITQPKPAQTNRFWEYFSCLKPTGSYYAGEGYDWQEMLIFSAVLGASAVLVLLAYAVSASGR